MDQNPRKPQQQLQPETKPWKRRDLAPRAWKPAPVELLGRVFELHQDGAVYEKAGSRGTCRRVKDRNLISQVYEAHRRRLAKYAEAGARTAALVARAEAGGNK